MIEEFTVFMQDGETVHRYTNISDVNIKADLFVVIYLSPDNDDAVWIPANEIKMMTQRGVKF